MYKEKTAKGFGDIAITNKGNSEFLIELRGKYGENKKIIHLSAAQVKFLKEQIFEFNFVFFLVHCFYDS